ncbi:E3 ubiquitin-protein ligase RNF185-like isoform X2 [Dreissena polymorpha]|uniref:RING-type E3 ubiquitin transferase n=1 Tax=Dreissena polymorpha TaxID=45954 RepID=A0A9D4N0B1_DREPO|nr:E3 ubiquitin-protein ligase RNF185-like isoform X2 [Dreissena polymorpha]KAH3887287.1 hypothetical protein DPMN_011303 [Dreissena polymorpha]
MSATDGEEAGGASGTSGSAESENAMFECNICLDTARDAVVSMCGHLFCWPCLHTWLETRPNRKTCPVCKAGISKEQVVPIYGRGSTDKKDPREKEMPPRPQGQRSEPEQQGAFPGFGFGDGGFHMSFGIGAFPFGIFASSFNFNNGRPGPPQPGSANHAEEQVLSKVFLFIAAIFMVWLLLA